MTIEEFIAGYGENLREIGEYQRFLSDLRDRGYSPHDDVELNDQFEFYWVSVATGAAEDYQELGYL